MKSFTLVVAAWLFLWHPIKTNAQESCFSALFSSDANGSFRLNQQEYVNFVKETSPDGLYVDVNRYKDLPLVLRSTFIALSCFCPQETSCCIGPTPFVPLYDIFDPTILESESDYMQSVCSVTERAIQQYVQQEEFPTASPTILSLTTKPTGSPTARPSPSPSRTNTSLPTPLPSTSQQPSVQDSGTPTLSPSTAPSIQDSDMPTLSPSTTPSLQDSGTPTLSPSTTPSIQDSDMPTMSPSATPSIKDSGVPTTAPSASPSIQDSGTPTLSPSTTPSSTPSIQDSGTPTLPPSTTPSNTPTTPSPSTTPSIQDSFMPTPLPSNTPTTPFPSIAPSIQDSTIPSAFPTTSMPSSLPTISISPSGHPSLIPTRLPSILPSQHPTTTPSPTNLPTASAAPTTIPIQLIEVDYAISTSKNLTTTPQQYIFDLIAAMDIVAAETAQQIIIATGGDDTRRQRKLLRETETKRRRLAVKVRLPTRIARLENVTNSQEEDCPTDLDEATQQCQRVNARVELVVTEEHANEETISAYRQALLENIQRGKLIEALALINPDSPVFIATGEGNNDESRDIESTPTISAGAIIGIAIAALVICVGSVILHRRTTHLRQENLQRQYASDIQPVEDLDLPQQSESDSSEQGYAMPFLQFQQSGDPQLRVAASGAAAAAGSSSGTTGYSLSPTNKKEGKDTVDDNASAADISYENSSGWSDNFSASMGSIEAGDLDSPSNKIVGSPPSAISNDPTTSQRLDDLEAAMSAGDWSAVGASAALLAASDQDMDQEPPRKNAKSLLRGNMDAPNSTMDEATAIEMEHMINGGDWEGVIQAAAKLEAAKPQNMSSDDDEELDGEGSSNSQASSSKSMQGFSVGGRSDPYAEDTQGKASSQGPDEEVRKQVVELVGKVVPEELDNVDEMIAQFNGREHELLETLRAMQERDIALKAKRAAQQHTKLELASDEKDDKMLRQLAAIEAAEERSQGVQDEEILIHHDDDDDSASL